MHKHNRLAVFLPITVTHLTDKKFLDCQDCETHCKANIKCVKINVNNKFNLNQYNQSRHNEIISAIKPHYYKNYCLKKRFHLPEKFDCI